MSTKIIKLSEVKEGNQVVAGEDFILTAKTDAAEVTDGSAYIYPIQSGEYLFVTTSEAYIHGPGDSDITIQTS